MHQPNVKTYPIAGLVHVAMLHAELIGQIKIEIDLKPSEKLFRRKETVKQTKSNHEPFELRFGLRKENPFVTSIDLVLMSHSHMQCSPPLL